MAFITNLIKLILIVLCYIGPLYCYAEKLSSSNDSTAIDTSVLREFDIKATRLINTVRLEIYIKHPENITSMTIDRSANYSDVYTTILTITPEQIKAIKEHVLSIDDKYPLPQTENIYYRVVVEDKQGIMRMFPPSEMPKINSTQIGPGSL